LNIGQRRVQRWVDRKAETDARASAAQAGVLFFLAKQDGALIGEVGAALQLAPSAMTGLADRMAKAGLLTRHADSDDGRATRLFLTDEGHAALKRARVAARAERQAVRRLLRRRTRRRRALAERLAAALSGRALTAGAARRIGCVHRVPHLIDSDSNSRFDSASEVFRRKILRACASRFGNAFRLRSVTKIAPRAAYGSPTFHSTSMHSS
jgi:DNA-binding MarR family transcriptional regulator